MTETIQDLKLKLDHLADKNRELLQRCGNLEATQLSLEQIIADNNSKRLDAEMISMELEQVFRKVTDAMWIVSDDGIVIRANDSMLQLLGKSSEDVIGKNCADLLSYGHCQKGSCPLKVAETNIQREYDIQLTGKPEDLEHYILSVAPLTTIVGSTGIVCQFKNITDRKRATQKLAELNETLKQIALVDGLTQIANRRRFDEVLAQEWKRLSRDKKPLSLLIADIDFFKKYNDHYGHQAGDDCLRRVGKALAGAILRPADLVARYGGEEFALILPEADLDAALHVGDRALGVIAELAVEHSYSDISEIVTISVGAATLVPLQDQSPAELIALADKALYQSKSAGRSRVTAAETRMTDFAGGPASIGL